MVRIGAAQQHILDNLRDAKAGYDQTVKQYEADLRARKEVAKFALYEKVQEALNAGIPARQVALKGLGYADVGSLKQFLTPPNAGVATAGEAREVPVPRINPKGAYPLTIKVYNHENQTIEVVDSTEAAYTLGFLVDEDGMPAEGFWDEFADSPDAEEIRELISEKYPTITDWND